ncbi:MAG: DnaB-like helicase C-terminal domain-containing protein [Faecousia sp.]
MKQDLAQYRRFLVDELTPDRKERGKYVCPLCGSGSRATGDGALSVEKDGIHAKCFSCGFYGDIFDLFAQRDGLSLSDATRAVIAKYGAPDARPSASTQTVSANKQPPISADAAHRQEIRRKVADFHAAIMGSDGYAYLQRRGISDKSIRRFRLGYDAAENRVTIPHDQAGNYYIARSIFNDPQIPKYMNPKGVDGILFNADALYTDAPCFIVESDLCAISIEQEGGKAVALAGTGGQQRLLNQIRAQTPTAPMLVVSLDNDEAGNRSAASLIAELEKQGLPVLQANISGNLKDPNELLVSDPTAFRSNIAAVHEQIREHTEAEERLRQQLEEQARAEYLAGNTTGLMDAFIDGIHISASTPAVPTGFPDLDRRLDGGLYEGLYILGAISSLGKTTFVHQMADQIAKGGHDILYFSLEMASFELIAKSISRLTYTISRSKDGTAALAKTTRGILAGKKWERYNDEEMSVIQEAVSEYEKSYSSRIWIKQGIGDIGVDQIRAEVEKHVKYTGHRPVVIIDYIQIVAPPDVRASDKQNTDKNVLELKRLSRDQKIPIVCISSLNRDNYTQPISMQGFKESGAIEYGSDVLIGLQLEGMDYEDGEQDKARERRIRDMRKQNEEKKSRGEPIRVELKILKNRNGVIGDPIPYLFTARYNHFAEATAQFTPADDAETPFDAPSKPRKRTVL